MTCQAPLDGIVLVDKPQGWTSHDVVARLRRMFGTRRVGHAGTLDPMATGLLIVGVNRATRLLTYFVGLDKTYSATFRLGRGTVTDDAEGEVTERAAAADIHAITVADIDAGLLALTGRIDQVPSAVSAIKVDGVRAYTRVRAGEHVSLAARPVTIGRLDRIGAPRIGDDVIDVDVLVECSSGTYVRALGRDLGAGLGVGAHVTALRRLRVGPFSVAAALALPQRDEDWDATSDLRFPVIPMAEAAASLFPTRRLSEAEADSISHGARIAPTGREGTVAALAADGGLRALIHDSDGAARSLLVVPPVAAS